MRVAVLGGGLQGACVALELGGWGVDVDLYDRNPTLLTQASAQNEGKIHLGYIYAQDRSLRTAGTMVAGAVVFEELLRRWLGDAVDRVPVSEPFHYAVHRDGLLGPDEVGAHLAASHAIAARRPGRRAYFGSDYLEPPVRLSPAECDSLYDGRTVAAAFRTAEIALDPEALAAAVRERVAAEPRIRCRLRTEVRAVEDGRLLTVRAESPDGPVAQTYDHVVNALWDGRLAVDRTMGLDPPHPWLFRVKHYVRLRAPTVAHAVPSTSVVLGPFGDIVSYGGDMYLSWYPVGLRGTSARLSPPAWPLVLDAGDAAALRGQCVAALTGIVPALEKLTPDTVESWHARAGIIFAWGRTGIDDPASGLHRRYAIGPRTLGRYHSVDTGKLTMAPLFGRQVADRIRAVGAVRGAGPA